MCTFYYQSDTQYLKLEFFAIIIIISLKGSLLPASLTQLNS